MGLCILFAVLQDDTWNSDIVKQETEDELAAEKNEVIMGK